MNIALKSLNKLKGKIRTYDDGKSSDCQRLFRSGAGGQDNEREGLFISDGK